MGGWWISDNWSDVNGPVMVVSWLVWVVVSITLHELAHGWTAIKLGDDTPIRSGHMTWNPMVHMGVYSFAALLLIGIAWGMMPVDTSRLRGKYADTLVSVAGPLMNLGLGLILLVALIFWEPLAEGYVISSFTVADPLKTNLFIFLKAGAFLNFVLMLFNLLPTPPLDGGRILMNLWSPYRRLMQSENGQWIGLGIFILFFVFVIDILVLLSNELVFGVMDVAQGLLFPSMG
ncbi:MAG: site-2 protease family protein [Phycisphaerales bacterium]|nr:site-2 protease family protein [Phycisphaerales bacterium]